MWNAIANMIIKAADNMQRGVENSTTAGEGNNGQNYQVENSEGVSTGGYKGTTQDTSSANSLAASLNKVTANAKDAIKTAKENDENKNNIKDSKNTVEEEEESEVEENE